MFIIDDPNNYVMVGCDASGLEARMEAHYCYNFEGGKEYAKELLEGDVHCYSGDTEVLTPNGWVRFDRLTKREKVLQYDLHSKELTFTYPIDYHRVKTDHFYEHPNSKMRVTANHKQLIVSQKFPYTQWEVREGDMSYTNGITRFLTAGNKVDGKDYDPTVLKLVVATQADGYIEPKSGSLRFEFKKERKIKRFRQLFSRFIYSESACKKGTTRFYIKGSSIKLPLLDGKKFSWDMIHLSKNSMEIILDEIEFWDGTRNNNSVILDTSCKQTVDVVTTLAALSGRKARSTSYKKYTSWSSDITIHRVILGGRPPYISVMCDRPTKIYTNEDAFCLTVETGWLLTRRKGQTVISGNSNNAVLFGLAPSLEKVTADIRDSAKPVKYGATYGAQAEKIAETMGCSKKRGQQIFDSFWDGNTALKGFRDQCSAVWKQRGGKNGGYLVGLDGRKIHTRSEHSLVNCMFQSAGSIVVKTATCYLFNVWVPKLKLDAHLVLHFHDEYNAIVHKNHADRYAELAVQAIVKAGEFWKLNVPLDGEAKIGKCWAEVH